MAISGEKHDRTNALVFREGQRKLISRRVGDRPAPKRQVDVCRGLEHAELINHTLSAFDYYNGLEHKLVMMAAEHAPVADMAEVIGKLIGAPFLVFGIDGTYLGGAHLDALDDEELLRGIREHGSFGASIIGSNFADESGKAQHDLSTKPTISRGPKGQFAVNMYLHDGREAPGFIMCFPLQVQHTHLAFALEPMLAEYLVAAHEFVNGTSPHQALHLALADLLAGRDVSEDAIGNIRHSLGPTQRLSVVLVRSLLIVNQTQRLLLVREVTALDFQNHADMLYLQLSLELLIPTALQ